LDSLLQEKEFREFLLSQSTQCGLTGNCNKGLIVFFEYEEARMTPKLFYKYNLLPITILDNFFYNPIILSTWR